MPKTPTAVPPPLPVEDREAVRRCVAGDERAAQVIYHRYRRDVEGVFSAQGAVRGADVSDFSQSVFLKVFRNLRGFAGTSLRPWIRQIAHNEKNNLLRQLIVERGRRGEAAAPIDELPGPALDPVRLCHARAWIARLPPEFRRTVELYLIEGLSHGEIAAALRVPEGTVKSRLHRAVALSEPRARRGPRAILLLGWLLGAPRALALRALGPGSPLGLVQAAACLGLVLGGVRPDVRGGGPGRRLLAPEPAAVTAARGRRPRGAAPGDEPPPEILPTFLAAARPLPLSLSPRGAYHLASVRGGGVGGLSRTQAPRWLEPAPPVFTRPPDPLPPGRPALRARDALGFRVAAAGPGTRDRIGLIERLLAVTPEGDPERPELLFRLAELEVAEERRLSAQARALDAPLRAAERAGASARAAALRTERDEQGRRERAALLDGIRAYLEIAAGPGAARYPRADRALFRLGALLAQQGKDEQARGFLLRLVQDHPQSPLLPHAYLGLAGYAYEARDLESAARLFDKVLEAPGSAVHGLARYLRGWVALDAGDPRFALACFAAALEEARARGDERLGREARRDITAAYARIGDPEKARHFFERCDAAHAAPMLEELAARYAASGQLAGSVKVYRELVRLRPGLDRLCGYQREILRATVAQAGGRAAREALTELERLQAVYERTRAAPEVPQAVVDECRAATAGALRELAFAWHREAARSGDGETAARAAAAYRAYLAGFSPERDPPPGT